MIGVFHDSPHRVDYFARIVADGRFAAEHTGVGAVQDGIGHVADFGPCGSPGMMHAF